MMRSGINSSIAVNIRLDYIKFPLYTEIGRKDKAFDFYINKHEEDKIFEGHKRSREAIMKGLVRRLSFQRLIATKQLNILSLLFKSYSLLPIYLM